MKKNTTNGHGINGVPAGRLAAIWQILTEPTGIITGVEERRQSRLLASMLIVILPLIIIVGIFMMPLLSGETILWRGATFFPALSAIICTIIAYILNRAGYYQPAAAIYVVIFIAAPLAAVAGDSSPANMPIAALMVGGVILASVLFPQGKAPLLAAAGTVAGVLSLLVLVPGTTFTAIAAVLSANLTNSALILVFAYYRNILEQDRQAELKEMHVALKDYSEQLEKTLDNVRHNEQALFNTNERLRQEINKRTQVEAELRESEKRYRILSEATFEGIAISEQGEIIDSNQQFIEMYGYTDTGVIGMEVWNFVAPESRELVKHRNLSGYDQPYEASQQRQDGSIFVANVSGKSMPYKGRTVRVTAIQDITTLKQAQDILKEYSERLEETVKERTQELHKTQAQLVQQEKLAVLGQLAGGVAHELRNPLGVITNAIYFLQMIQTEADETIREYLSIIADRVTEAEKIITALLNFSHTRLPMPETIVISNMVTAALEHYPPPHSVQVKLDLSPSLPPVLVDKVQFEQQVLPNLLTNAYQALPNGGRLTISARSEEGWLKLYVTDTGAGMSQKVMRKIFEPLFTTKAKGIGLGLAVSQKLVEVNGGCIEAESAEGQGSTFILTLPARL